MCDPTSRRLGCSPSFLRQQILQLFGSLLMALNRIRNFRQRRRIGSNFSIPIIHPTKNGYSNPLLTSVDLVPTRRTGSVLFQLLGYLRFIFGSDSTHNCTMDVVSHGVWDCPLPPRVFSVERRIAPIGSTLFQITHFHISQHLCQSEFRFHWLLQQSD
jgi:hypothetical protein